MGLKGPGALISPSRFWRQFCLPARSTSPNRRPSERAVGTDRLLILWHVASVTEWPEADPSKCRQGGKQKFV